MGGGEEEGVVGNKRSRDDGDDGWSVAQSSADRICTCSGLSVALHPNRYNTPNSTLALCIVSEAVSMVCTVRLAE